MSTGSNAELPPGELCAKVGREDLLPAVMALERGQVCGADEALRLVVEARPSTSTSAAARRAGVPVAPDRRLVRRAGRPRTCSSRRRARRRPRRRARPSRRSPRAATRGRSAAPTNRRTARRTRPRAPARAAPHRGGARALGVASRNAPRRVAHRRARRTSAPRSRSRTCATARSSPRAARAARNAESTPPESRTPTGTSLTRCARTESRRRDAQLFDELRLLVLRGAPSIGAGRAKRRASTRPSSQISRCPGGSLRISRKIVSGAGIELNARNASSASRSISPRGSARSSEANASSPSAAR